MASFTGEEDVLNPGRLAQRVRGAVPTWLIRTFYGVAAILLLLIALETTKAGADGLSNILVRLDVVGAANSLGFGWLFAYIALSGSPVAALSVSLLAGGAFSEAEAFAGIAGSRLGASFIVILVGAIAYLRGRRQADGLAVGVVAFITTAATQIPGFFLGLLSLRVGWLDGVQIATPSALLDLSATFTEPLVSRFDALLPGPGLFVGGVVLLLTSFMVFDRAIPQVSEGQTANRWLQKVGNSKWLMFAAGAAATLVTLSVAISLTLLIPLALRGYVRRDQVIPYVMGANITTFVDTLVVAMLVGGQVAFVVVFTQMAVMAFLSVVILLFAYRPFAAAVLWCTAKATGDRRRFAGFIGIITVVPLGLLFV